MACPRSPARTRRPARAPSQNSGRFLNESCGKPRTTSCRRVRACSSSGPRAPRSALTGCRCVDGGVRPPDELQGVDAVALAAQLEESMYRELGAGTPYKNKLRSLLFNLKDAKNTTLVTRVMCGSITPEGLVTMNPKDMASDATKDWRKKVAEYKKMELMDQQSYQRYAHGDREQPDGLFECPKCKSQKTEYTEKQTRSADEPTTKFCHCISCEYRWKFC
mmetsp:Transcript_8739/g.29764  ORF Transcript_8739/g.29764 Transcript_8739/m.29764 type:complete len:220 (+) Transcript_8739:484-1143(+)